MDIKNEKCVIVLDEMLPIGLIANTAAILGITLGEKFPEVVGDDVQDADGKKHMGIIEFPVPILKGTAESIKELRKKLYESSSEEILCVDFSDVAQSCKTYDEFIEKMKTISTEELKYLGICICGPKKKVNKLTGNLPLLR